MVQRYLSDSIVSMIFKSLQVSAYDLYS